MTAGFLDRILSRYANTFDITRPFRDGDRDYAAYAYFFKKDEHYVAIRRATLWSFHQTEHVLFSTTPRADEGLLAQMRETAFSHIEPQLIRGGEKYPKKDHMESLITLVMISERTPAPALLAEIRRARYFRSYLFHFRGHTRLRVILADLESGTVTANRDGRDLKLFFQDLLDKYKKKMSNEKIVDFNRKKQYKEEKTV